MNTWLIIVVGTAVGGALMAWHSFGQTKQLSEKLLRQYGDELADARKKRAEELAKRAAEQQLED